MELDCKSSSTSHSSTKHSSNSHSSNNHSSNNHNNAILTLRLHYNVQQTHATTIILCRAIHIIFGALHYFLSYWVHVYIVKFLAIEVVRAYTF